MRAELDDLAAFVAVARRQGFRQAARIGGTSASRLSEAVRRLEARTGVRLLNRTTRSVTPTEAGRRLLDELTPALGAIETALDTIAETRDRPAGTLRLNVPLSVARLVLPPIVTGFCAAYPDIRLDITVEDGLVDILAAGADAGIRYGEHLHQDMIAIPIGPRVQRFAAAAAPAYLAARGVPAHPRDLLGHACLRSRFSSGALTGLEFERDGALFAVDPPSRLTVSTVGLDLSIAAAVAGQGVITTFEGFLRPALDAGTLVPVLAEWWQDFPGPFLYYPSRRHMPTPLRAFVDYVRSSAAEPIAA